MQPNTTEFWDVDGVPLNTFCWSVISYGGSRQSLPSLRGENKLYPNMPGRSFRKKTPDAKVITLAMWVLGADPETGEPGTYDQMVQWNDNWQFLKRLFWTPNKEITLTRRWKANVDSPELIVASTKAQIAGPMEPTMTGRTRATFAVDLLLSDPFFYGEELEYTIDSGETLVINNPGDSRVSHKNFTVTFDGYLLNPKLTNTTNGVFMWPQTVINLDTNIVADIENYRAIRSTDGKNMALIVVQGGDSRWMALESGDNTLQLQGEAGGSATIKFKPPYV